VQVWGRGAGGGRLEELQTGDPPRVGPYLLLGRLGAGGMGRVFLGRSPGGRLVAVKVIRAELAENSGFRARFAREVAAARRVSGLFTATVVDADPEATLPWLVTGYVAGPSLAQAVADHGPLPVASVLALAAGLAEGLDAVHAAGVVHRDLKPSNVLLAEDGPRVIDFGISQAAEVTMLTETGTVVGSPGFMSPEQAEGAGVGPASDIFTLGAVLAFAATGDPPFGDGAATAQLYRVVHGKPRLDQMPVQVRPLAERCLAKDPQERPTARQFLAELTAAHPSAADLAGWLPAPVLQASWRRPAAVNRTPAPAAAGPAEPGAAVAGLAGPPPTAGYQAAAAPGPPAPGFDGPSTITTARPYRTPESASPVKRQATDVVWPASPAPAQGRPDTPVAQAAPASPVGRPALMKVKAGIPGSPVTAPRAAASLGRGRRRSDATGIAVVAVLVTIAGLAIWAPWRSHPVSRPSPPVLQPAGLVASTSTTSSVAFSWSSPATGPVPSRYMISQDGTVIGSVPGTITYYQANGLAPDSSYHYQVIAVRGRRRSSWSSSLTVGTLVPPVSAANLNSAWTVHYKVVRSGPNDLYFLLGKTWTDSWSFVPHCTTGPCAVRLSGIISGPGKNAGINFFTAKLTRAGAVYTGTTRAHVEVCEPTSGSGPTTPVHDRLRFRIRIKRARVIDQTWTASSWAGHIVMYSPYTPDPPLSPCPAYSDKFTIRSHL